MQRCLKDVSPQIVRPSSQFWRAFHDSYYIDGDSAQCSTMTATTLEHEEPVDGTPAKQWPQWFDDWSRGERLVVKEWDQGDLYRLKNGWQVSSK